jgi:hypothetical protein
MDVLAGPLFESADQHLAEIAVWLANHLSRKGML